jgi:nitrite reductase/ring-hydroxylating ferredoxin subunit
LLMCAHHSAMFRFEDGLCIDGPCQGAALMAVAIRIEHGQVFSDG